MLTLLLALALNVPSDLPPLVLGEHVFHRRVLENGLRAVAVRDPGAETVSVFVVVGVGSGIETADTAGLAHLVEHAMFTGTPTVGVDQHEHTVKGWGGEANAYTREDYTLYYDHGVPAEHLDRVLAMEADRLRNLTFDEAAVLHERERLRSEEEHTYQAAEGRVEELEAAVYGPDGYGAGVRDEAGHTRAPLLGMDTVRAFYDRWYHPERVCVVVVAPDAPEEVLDRVQRAFASVERGAEVDLPEFPAPAGRRDVRLPSNLRRDRVELVARVPARDGADRAALEVLAAWLDRQELAGAVPVEASIGARVREDLVRVAAAGEGAAEGLHGLLERARTAPVGADELREVSALLADDLVGMPLRARPYFSLAATFGAYEVAGHGEHLAALPEALRAVTPDEVREAARHWLAEERVWSVVFEGSGEPAEPLPEDPKALAAAAEDAADAGDYDRAIEAYGRLLAGDPGRMNTVIYLATRGQLFMELRSFDAAIEDFEAALAVVDYPAVRELLEEAHARKAGALRGAFEEAEDAGDGDAAPEAEAHPEPAGEPAAATDDLRAELTASVQGVMEELERWRGLRFQGAVVPELVDAADDASLGGWYEPDSGRLVVVTGKGAAFSRGAQLHEIFHALQDQTWDLSVLDEAVRTTDQQHALQGLIEGEAMLAVAEILDYDFERHAVLPAEGEIAREKFEKVFHYGTGLRFVRALRDAGGWPAVNRCWGAPPTATSELFHPERYRSARPEVALPASVTGDVLESDVRGELEVRWLLVEDEATRGATERLAAAFRADRWWKVRGAGGQREVWVLDFEAEGAAHAFAREGAHALAAAGWTARVEGGRVVLER